MNRARIRAPHEKEVLTMVDILHRIGVTSSPEAVYTALTTVEGLAGWWTEDTGGDSEPGGIIRFRFGGAPEPGGFDMKVLEARPGERVLWEVVDGPEEWVGTQIGFELSQEDGYTIVMFRHTDWREAAPFMYHCSTKWATFLMSLKQYVETGTGEPAPDDVRISNWH
jgi:uncharacterized protein YndB with AHSA1/START domain